MQKVDVQMSPKPYDTKRLFCSQGDTELRKFGFRLMDGLNEVDTSNISDPVFTSFPVEVGGTEELLPSSLMNGQVDLGSLTWTKADTLSSYRFQATVDGIKRATGATAIPNLFCSKYKTITPNNTWNADAGFGITVSAGADLVMVYDTSFTTADAFKNAMQGVMLYFEKTDSTPATSPILADIQYPDGLREDESFTCRESPTTVDGKAKVKVLKGNTLVWNQLVRNGNFPSKDTSIWRENNASTTVSNNVLSFTATQGSVGVYQSISGVTGHKYLLMCTINTTDSAQVGATQLGSRIQVTTGFGSYQTVSMIGTASASSIVFAIYTSTSRSTTVNVKNAMLFDLTQMGLDISDPSEFTSLFPLPYYQFDSGSLLSFNGTGIKTTGFNQWDEQWESGAISASTGNPSANTSYSRSKNFCKIFPNTQYYRGIGTITNFGMFWYDANFNYLGVNYYATPLIFTTPSNAHYFKIHWQGTTYNNDICINISGDKDGQYEPYTESTTSLPTLTYFPTGMKSAGSVRDELTDSKATTRVNQITFDGSSDEAWSVVTGTHRAYIAVSDINTSVLDRDTGNITSNLYLANPYNGTLSQRITTRYNIAQINIFDTTNITSSSTVDTWKAYLQSHPLIVNYELATSSEESIMSASLVTENAEIPLYVSDDMLVGDCTEELSASAGILDAKIKFTDADGDCYSNKLKISVEARP